PQTEVWRDAPRRHPASGRRVRPVQAVQGRRSASCLVRRSRPEGSLLNFFERNIGTLGGGAAIFKLGCEIAGIALRCACPLDANGSIRRVNSKVFALQDEARLTAGTDAQ